MAHNKTCQLVQNKMATRWKIEITEKFQLVIYCKNLVTNLTLIYTILSIAFLQHRTTFLMCI